MKIIVSFSRNPKRTHLCNVSYIVQETLQMQILSQLDLIWIC